MADEQSSALARIESRERLSDVIRTSVGELVSIEEALAELDRDASPSYVLCPPSTAARAARS